MADAYRVLQDTSIPRAIREVDTLVDGQTIYETEGRTYAAGQVVAASDISPTTLASIENGDFEGVVEEISQKDYDEASAWERKQDFGVFIPEHEAEAVVLEDYGHQIVPRDQVLQLKSAGADAAKAAMEAAKDSGADERPNLSARPWPSEVDRSKGDAPPAGESDGENHVDTDLLEEKGVEQPPGTPIGNALAKAEGADEEAEKPRRQRPRRAASSDSGEGSDS